VAQYRGRGGTILTPNELVLSFVGFYVCANFGKNRSRNATDRYTDRLTDANRFYNLSHAICYSYGTDNYTSLPSPESLYCKSAKPAVMCIFHSV